MHKQESLKLPYFSALVCGSTTDGADTFGYTWKECLRPALFFTIEVDNTGIQSIRNVLHGRGSDYCIDRTNRVFVLMDGETVTQVDVCKSPPCVRGLRFHTNKRVSQWIGDREGFVSTVKAPDGYFIHLLAGYRGYPSLGRSSNPYVLDLRVLFAPVRKPPACDHSGQLSYSDSVSPVKVSEAHPDMRAIVVNTSRGLSAVHALSAWDVTVLAALSDRIGFLSDEHLFELLPDERVMAVRLVKGRKVQFQTTYRVTPWYGQDINSRVQADATAFDVTTKPEGSYICGFQTHIIGSGFTRCEEIGVVYWTPTAKTAT
jgi:hypothetical protein